MWKIRVQTHHIKVLMTPSAQEPRILVVEDDTYNQRVISMQIKHLGYAGDVVASAPEALHALQKQIYDLVLLDCRLPAMDGVGFVQAVRSQSTQPWNRIVIIAVTADPINFSQERCLESGMNDWLLKPYRTAELSFTIGRWLGQAKA
jgi:two-component system, sensor histidine kinase SagS